MTMSSSAAATGNGNDAPPRDVLVVGGGLAGLATASALVNVAKIPSVRILEASSEECFADHTAGAAIQLGPNGLRALKYIFAGDGQKVVDEILEQGAITKGNVLLGLPGCKVGQMTIPDTAESETGLPQVLIPWGALRATLQRNLPDSVKVVTGQGKSVAGYTVGEDGAVIPVTMACQESQVLEETWNRPTLVVGADGKRSAFRQFVRLGSQMLDSDSASSLEDLRGYDLNHGKRTNIKAVVKQPIGGPASPEGFKYEANHSYSYFVPCGGLALFAGPAGNGYTYWAISIADTPPSEEDGGEACPTPFASEGGDRAQVKAKLLTALSEMEYPSKECDFGKQLVEQTDPSKILIQRSEEAKDIGPHLHTVDGRVVLVGDAAHAMSGSYGQAANFCFEDAATLAACLREESTDGHTSRKAALEKYSSMRVNRCIEMQQRSSERAAKSMKGEKTENVSHWIFRWEAPEP